MTAPAPSPTLLVIADLPGRKPTRFVLSPDAATCDAIAARLELSDLRKLRLAGEIRPQGGRDWALVAQLGATVVQPCSVTLDPVTTRIEDSVERLYVADLPEIAGQDIEMPDDDRLEPLSDQIDLLALAEESLALAIPAYPRADGARLDAHVFAAPGVTPMTDDDAKPFAGLAQLRDRLRGTDPRDDD